MALTQVKPTRMELTRTKRRLVTARRGHKLLKDKRDELARRFIALIRDNASLRREVENDLQGALRGFAMARAVMEPLALEEAIMVPARQAEVTFSVRNILSVRVPDLAVGPDAIQDTVQAYGFADTSADLDDSIRTLAELLPKLLRLAQVEKACSLLAVEIEKTRRRVNALEYVMIPRFEETISLITMKLEENERGALVRLMKVKDMISQREA